MFGELDDHLVLLRILDGVLEMKVEEADSVDEDDERGLAEEVDCGHFNIRDLLRELFLDEEAEVNDEDDVHGDDVDGDHSVVVDSQKENRDFGVEGEALDEEGRQVVALTVALSHKDEAELGGRDLSEHEEIEVVVVAIVRVEGDSEQVPLRGVLELADSGSEGGLENEIERKNEIGGAVFFCLVNEENELACGLIGALDGPEVVALLASEVLFET